VACVNRTGYGNKSEGLDNPQPSPNGRRSLIRIRPMDAVQRLDVGGLLKTQLVKQ